MGHTKLRELVEFEELARIIMLEGTFWTHYQVTTPGNIDKLLLDEATQKQSLEELANIAKTLSDVCYWKNQEILGIMVKRAKEYVTKMRSNLTSYTDVAQLTEAIIFTESAITSCEDVIAKEAGRTIRTSSSDPSLYTTASPSVTTPLTSTPTGEHSLSKSMIPISTYVGGPAHGHNQIQIKMPNPSQEPPVSSKAAN